MSESLIDERGRTELEGIIPSTHSGRFSAYFLVNSSAALLNFFRSSKNELASSGRRGWPGSGSLMSDSSAIITENTFPD